MVESESQMPAGWYPYPKTGNPYKDTEYRYWDGDRWLEPPRPPLWKYLVVTLWGGAMIAWYGFCILFIVLVLYFILKG
jgi:hypothetical protein